MSEENQSTHGLAAAFRSLRDYLLEKGNDFKRGPAYEGNGKVLSGINETVQYYESLGYTKLLELGDPPVFALLKRGHSEAYIFQPRDPKIRAWLENDDAPLNDPLMQAYLLDKFGLSAGEVSATTHSPHHFHVNEVDNVFIARTDDG